MKPNLVLIQGNLAARYVDGKQEQIVEIDWTSAPKHIVRKNIEHFRKYGLDEVVEEQQEGS